MSTHEDNIKKEFEAAEAIQAEAVVVNEEKVTNLGKVDPTRGMGITSPDDPEIKRIQ